ncbi:MAG: MarR family winged helix-turn-helix transcriptional regulator [Acidimicrobiales bacterium]
MEPTARPDVLQAWLELSETTSVMRARLNQRLQSDAGLSLADNLVLCQVAMAPDARMRMVEIAEVLNVVKSAVTKTVDRLEGRGLLARVREGDDRRSVHAALTAAGAEVFRRAQPVFLDAVSEGLYGPLSAAEVNELRRLLGKLLGAGRARRAEPPSPLEATPGASPPGRRAGAGPG